VLPLQAHQSLAWTRRDARDPTLLSALETADPRAARVVELRFFGGMQEEEIAEALGVSVITVKRDWKAARAWLAARLQ
jgi:RNA polymerase sigma factor (sigma-70 family)